MMKNKGKWIAVLAVTVMAFNTFSSADQKNLVKEITQQFKDVEESEFKTARISYGSVRAPLGCFVIIRNKNDVCAVRFTKSYRGNDGKPPATFSSGEENLYAEYDWYYQGDGSGDFTKENVKSGHKVLRRGPMVGINRLAIQSGTNVIECGPFNLGWRYPSAIGFNTTYRRKGDPGNEMSPTSWSVLQNVNISDKRLRWFRFDEGRGDVILPISDL